MEHIGRVIAVKGEQVDLEVRRMSGCGTSCESCSASCEQKIELITLPNLVHAKVGDFVEIEMDTSFIIKSMFRIYGIPLLLFMITIVAVNSLGLEQIFSFIAGLLSFVLSFFILKLLDGRSESKNSVQIVKVLN